MLKVVLLIGGLFGGAFVTNVAVSLLPHEPLVIWYGRLLGVWQTALFATLGTVAASAADILLFKPFLMRQRARFHRGPLTALIQGFDRAPFSIIAISGLTPLPFWPFKLLVLSSEYPVAKYLTAVAAGRLPRYAVLAWLGRSIPFPSWAVAAACALFSIWLIVSQFNRRHGERL